MNSFTGIEWPRRYRSGDEKAKPRLFYNQVLPLTKFYRRAVGFFSSTCFLEISYGILELVKNDGKMQLITSPRLQEDDVKAIQKGYDARNIYLGALKRDMLLPQTIDEKNRLNVLANLIEQNVLEIKIAVTEDPEYGMYHEKIGLFIDNEGNTIAISGSSNESRTAISKNFESFQVFCDWKPDYKERVEDCINDFEDMWNDKQADLKIFNFPELPKDFIKTYKTSTISIESIKRGEFDGDVERTLPQNIPMVPKWLQEKKYDYQENAVENWRNQGYCGIFDMATGTGKTITALIGVSRLYEDAHKKGEKIFVIIVCPYQHLVDQWVEDLEDFNILPIIGYSSSPQKDWKIDLQKTIIDLHLKSLSKDFACFICTNATFSSKFVQSQIEKVYIPKVLVVDEAHNFGAPYLSKWLLDSYKYRLGLSATIDRHGDEEGTEKLFDFFGEKCIEYDIERAIREKKLTQYKYYPVLVNLNDDELANYIQITREMKKYQFKDNKGVARLKGKGKILAMQRARIIAGAKSKILALKEKITPYKDDTHILVYCGATTILLEDEDATSVDENEERQIVTISKMLGNELGIKNHHFTSNETNAERIQLKKLFSNGTLQALVAIKCLDEGVNIPEIRTAFILASTTNPKEYIQRRGRVLRLASGKDFAEIYDFITLPYSLDYVSSLTEAQINEVKPLVIRELRRAVEFSRIALNWIDAESILSTIRDVYHITELSNVSSQQEIYNG